ncbi:hypothetical protein SO802_013288 [Lithocarpus litseifolius]|uniref:Uncharacterized protein n=1 Tax=Lithocarpus litseifolius TaxID=425828 RepID=A0AAW2D5S3_9ROSI
MATPSDIEVANRIYKMVEDQGKVHEKMGSHLAKLEQSKLKKPINVEVNEEEEKGKWDEKDKADYERNKKFKKLTAKTLAMKEKMEKMQLAFHKAQGMGDCLYNMSGSGSKTPIPLPHKFKISDTEKFD